jgi:hypothetical protein
MTRKLEIEANLDRSLANQVKAPRLGRAFDASVWARIEAAEQRASNPVQLRAPAPSSARWMFAINLAGIAVAAVLVVIFGMQSFADVSVSVPAPQISAATEGRILQIAAQTLTLVSVVFGLMFTPLGRRLRAEFS